MALPAPVPPVPDADRYASYTLAVDTSSLTVNFPVYGSGEDITVKVNGQILAPQNWQFVSNSGPLNNLPLPITDGVINFSPNVLATSFVEIIGSWQARNLTIPTSPGITRREFEQTINTVISGMREVQRAQRFPPVALQFNASGPLASRTNFDNQVPPFVYLQTDDSLGRPIYYVKNSATAGDWSQALIVQVAAASVSAALGFTPESYGAVGDGLHDDTTAVQTAINNAQAVGGVVLLSQAYKITSTLTATARVTIRGTGFQSDRGAGPGYINPPGTITAAPSGGWKGGTLLPVGTINCFSYTSSDAVTLDGFQIVYYYGLVSAGSGVTAVSITCSAGSTSVNVDSLLQNLFIYGADINVSFNNCVEFKCSNVYCEQHFTTGISVNGSHYPSAGDWTIERCQFTTGSTVTCQHILLLATAGGARIENNKFNTGGSINTTYGILVAPTITSSFNLEPMLIVGNSIEGLTIGIYMYGGNPSQAASINQLVIVGNQIWCSEAIVSGATASNGQWISGVTITGNVLAGSTANTNVVQLDGMLDAVITGNLFGQSSTNAQAISIGVNTANIAFKSNWKQSSQVTLGTAAVNPSFPSSGVGLANTYGSVMEVSLFNGLGTVVTVNGSTVMSQSSGPFAFSCSLNPGDTIIVTYSSTPNWLWRAVNP